MLSVGLRLVITGQQLAKPGTRTLKMLTLGVHHVGRVADRVALA
eukprot:CAMPEP_0198122064 /NCGR_PEP_ID=MMETSP1442-20131203/33824_1 /TAXON_ID= /ORGANISM="Craspedostauros australis, Strain CCMP3328" /LENGTH=43 /DNA_ID= /DNA_START= /DNA_END= /DNA_ORIENTATION=